MARIYKSLALSAVMAVLLVPAISSPSHIQPLSLLSPTEGQVVRENVRIVVPASAIPDGGFLAILVGEPGQEVFMAGLAVQEAVKKGDNLVFYWNSKEGFPDPVDPKTEKFLKDGSYSLKVQVHDRDKQADPGGGSVISSGCVGIKLHNRIDRPNPAPGVSLANKLTYAQATTFNVHSEAQFFEMANLATDVGLPILGGIGLSSDFKILQSVEDVRPNGEYLLRCRMGENPSVTSFGNNTILYADQELKPQLYRLIDKYGDVISANVFRKQGRYTMMDTLPVFPRKAIKEGDTWPNEVCFQG